MKGDEIDVENVDPMPEALAMDEIISEAEALLQEAHEAETAVRAKHEDGYVNAQQLDAAWRKQGIRRRAFALLWTAVVIYDDVPAEILNLFSYLGSGA